MSLQNTVPRSLVEERERIEEHFQRVQEDRLKLVREKISTEEKTRSGKMCLLYILLDLECSNNARNSSCQKTDWSHFFVVVSVCRRIADIF